MKIVARISPKNKAGHAFQGEEKRGTRLLSFSLYGRRLSCLFGAIKNLEEQARFYPEWRCRFYVAEDVVGSVTDQLSAGGAEVIIMQPEPGIAGMFWRYLAADEDNLDACLMLDVDSPLHERHRRATEEWLNSEKFYHVIRDHRFHRRKIMGGLFGMKGSGPVVLNMRQEMESFISRWKGKAMGYESDQEFLAQIVYPRIKEHTLFHVDPGFVIFPGENARSLPGPKRTDLYYAGCYRPFNLLNGGLSLAKLSIKRLQVMYAFYFLYRPLAYYFNFVLCRLPIVGYRRHEAKIRRQV